MRALRLFVAATAVGALVAPTSSAQQATYSLSVSVSGGRVMSSPAGIDCGERTFLCLASFPAGTEVTLTASQIFPDHPLTAWGGECTGAEPTCTLVLDRDRSASAQFGSPTPARRAFLTVSKRGKGKVRSVPVGIDCGSECTVWWSGATTTVTLIATPALRARFVRWGGACRGRARTCRLTVEGITDVTATFTEPRVFVCHRRRSLAVPESQGRRHLRHGDRVGRCRTRRR